MAREPIEREVPWREETDEDKRLGDEHLLPIVIRADQRLRRGGDRHESQYDQLEGARHHGQTADWMAAGSNSMARHVAPARVWVWITLHRHILRCASVRRKKIQGFKSKWWRGFISLT